MVEANVSKDDLILLVILSIAFSSLHYHFYFSIMLCIGSYVDSINQINEQSAFNKDASSIKKELFANNRKMQHTLVDFRQITFQSRLFMTFCYFVNCI